MELVVHGSPAPLRAHLLRSSSRRRTTTSTIKMKTMKSILP
jgi:hypothetical protein